LIRVRAVNVVEDARLDTAAIDQDFALVVSGPLLSPDQGEVLLDRTNYTAPGKIALRCSIRAGRQQLPLSVHLTSTTEPAGVSITLYSTGGFGVFTNVVATVVGSPAAGQLEIHNGDGSRLRMLILPASRKRLGHGRSVPPVISDVSTNFDLGVITSPGRPAKRPIQFFITAPTSCR
jgi:hypothetical protein